MKIAIPITLASFFLSAAAWGAVGSSSDALSKLEADMMVDRRATDQQIETVADYLKTHAADAYAHFLCGEAYDSIGMQSLAEEEFDKACRQDPNYLLKQYKQLLDHDQPKFYRLVYYVGQRYPHDPALLLGRARLHLKNHLFLPAEQDFTEAISGPHPHPGTYGYLADYLLSIGSRSRALKCAEQELREDPSNATALKVRAIVLAETRPELVRQELPALANKNPNSWSLQYWLAQQRCHDRAYAGALQPALQGLLHAGNRSEIQRSEQQMKLLAAQLPVSVLDCELDKYAPTTSHNFMRALLRLRMANTYAAMNDHVRAAKQLAMALPMNTVLAPRIYYRLGQEYQWMNQDQLALQSYKLAYEQRPSDTNLKDAYLRFKACLQNKPNDLAGHIREAINTWRFGNQNIFSKS